MMSYTELTPRCQLLTLLPDEGVYIVFTLKDFYKKNS
jgi:hypothetical protein